MEAKDRLIIALDTTDLPKARSLVEALAPHAGMFKVGSTLFTAHGPAAVWALLKRGAGVFLDLKFHDLPREVEKASCVAVGLGVHVFTVHCLGGVEMMAAARKGVAASQAIPTAVLGVTVLTHHDYPSLLHLGLVQYVGKRMVVTPEVERHFQQGEVQQRAVQLALDAKEAGLDGVVSSPQEVAAIRNACGPAFRIVAVGIHHAGSIGIGHRRDGSTRQAILDGADYVVVGALITGRNDPVEVAQGILAEIAAAMAERR